ncbi:MAG: hypothetical protein KGZ63_05305 [Clostridiales bacterium]|nr:hypothetical protein [Clostridiales bacterium]
MKTIRRILVFGLVLALLAVGAGCTKQAAENGANSQRRQIETVKPNENDGQIYRNVETFVSALVKDDRNTVLEMLTKDHRNSWSDNSFLFNAEAKNRFDEFAAENLNYTIVKYVNNEDTNFVETAFIIAAYDVVMKKGGTEASRAKIQESMAFRKEDGQWKISVNERGLLVSNQ